MTAGKAVVIKFRKLPYLNNRSEQDGFFYAPILFGPYATTHFMNYGACYTNNCSFNK